MNKETLLLSFSGGRTSAFMTQWCLKNLSEKYEMVVVFANTGKEREETLEFVDKCDKYFKFNLIWVEAVVNPIHGKGIRAKIVDFETASRNGEPFKAVIDKFGLPNIKSPFCSRDLKKYPIESYLKKQLNIKKFKTAIGIRADESNRINWNAVNNGDIIYPLVTDIRTTKNDINIFWSKMPFDLSLKSYEGNCDLCWKKSFRKLMTIAKEHPELTNWWVDIENKYSIKTSEIVSKKTGKLKNDAIFMFRGNQSMNDIIEESKFPFDEAKDESKIIDNQLSFWQEDLDSNFGCTESCEAF